jgi:CII-binding regulator of phage lambda lysogenization HflD
MTNGEYSKVTSAIVVLNTYFRQSKDMQESIKELINALDQELDVNDIEATLNTLYEVLFGDSVE